MIKALRVDERLVHGQITMLWTKELGINGIVVGNDAVSKDEPQKQILKMAVPDGIKIIIKSVNEIIRLLNDPRTKKMKLLVIVSTVRDAVKVAQKIPHVEYMNIGNVGRMSGHTDLKQVAKTVMLTPNEIESLKELIKMYPQTAIQSTPYENKELASKLIS